MSLFTGLRLISDRVLDLVYPSLCVYCGKSLLWQDNNILCSDCSGLLNRIDKTSCWFCSTPLGKYSQRQKECSECRGNKLRFTRVVAACSYNDVARELIHAYKFGNMKYVYRLIADYMYDKFIQEYSETHFNYILPVPLLAAAILIRLILILDRFWRILHLPPRETPKDRQIVDNMRAIGARLYFSPETLKHLTQVLFSTPV